MSYRFNEVNKVKEDLRSVDYLADDGIAGIVYLADRLQKPILVEGPAGTGKTQLAKSVAEMTGSRLIRLQCYEGLDGAKALYEWKYKKFHTRSIVHKKRDINLLCLNKNYKLLSLYLSIIWRKKPCAFFMLIQ